MKIFPRRWENSKDSYTQPSLQETAFRCVSTHWHGGRRKEACDEPRLDSITQPSSSLQQQGCDRSSAAYSTDLCVYVYYYIDIPPHFAAPLAEHSNAVCNVCFSQNLLVSVVPYTLKGGSVCYYCPFFSVKSKVTYIWFHEIKKAPVWLDFWPFLKVQDLKWRWSQLKRNDFGL